MKLFSALYKRAMRWPIHPHASRYLAGLSFPESSFIPIKPQLAPMALTKPGRVVLRPYIEQIGWIVVMPVIAAYFILNSVNG